MVLVVEPDSGRKRKTCPPPAPSPQDSSGPGQWYVSLNIWKYGAALFPSGNASIKCLGASLLQWNLRFHSFLSPKVSCWQKRNHFLKHIGQINVIIDVLMDFSYFADTLTTTFSIKYQYTFNCLLLSLKINIHASEVKCSLHNMFLTWLRTRPPFKAASESGHVSGCVHTSWCPTSPSSSCSRRRPSHRSENKSSTGGFPVWNTGNATISIQWALIHLQCELKINTNSREPNCLLCNSGQISAD